MFNNINVMINVLIDMSRTVQWFQYLTEFPSSKRGVDKIRTSQGTTRAKDPYVDHISWVQNSNYYTTSDMFVVDVLTVRYYSPVCTGIDH